jgi:hypothetical protein
MGGQNMSQARCEALFVSALQGSEALTRERVADAITSTLRQFGHAGCASRMAQEFGDHPELARDRMRWARQILSELPA